MVSKYDYSVTLGDRLGRPLAKELAALFSSAYGKWSRRSPVNPGGRIRLGADYYLKNYGNGLFRIATCRAGTRLIAQAVDLEDAYSQIVDCSGRFVAEAYRRQPQARQKWAAKAGEEMDNLLRWLPAVGKDTPVCDFGAGTGRHVAELRRHLRKGGFAAISVANAGFSGLRGTSVDSKNRRALIKSIFRLAPSRTMATTGEFLSAKSVLRNRSKGLFYHKEQFFGGSGLPGEYLVVDRRYTAGEIEALVEKAGLRVVMRRFVRSGFSKDLSEGDGKEILVIANKVTTRRTGKMPEKNQ